MLRLTIEESEKLNKVCYALSSKVRTDILKALDKKNMNVNEIAAELGIAVSTAAFNINILEEAGILTTQYHSGKRGAKKICSKNYDDILLVMNPDIFTQLEYGTYEIEMPIGHFSDCSVAPTCGIAGEKSMLTLEDAPWDFYKPERINAELIWFRHGFIEYRFPKGELIRKNLTVENIQFSMEICSEAPNYNNDWPSDITLWVNDVELATWTSPADFGGKRGILNPDWWYDHATQYGMLKTWDITYNGSYEDGRHVSDVTIADIQLDNYDFIKLKIGIKEDAVNLGGINLFGKKFGNHDQAILMKVKYSLK